MIRKEDDSSCRNIFLTISNVGQMSQRAIAYISVWSLHLGLVELYAISLNLNFDTVDIRIT